MNKNNLQHHTLVIRSYLAVICLLGMVCGFLFSRAALSLSMMVFGANALLFVHPRHWFSQKWWLVSVILVGLYALSYFWSDNIQFWQERTQVKLPLLLLPLAFAFTPRLTARQLQLFTVLSACIMLGCAGYTMSFLIGNVQHYVEQYNISHVLPTIPKDHIRASLIATLFIIWYAARWKHLEGRAVKWFIGFTIVFLSLYLHVLAVKTGLLAWYLFVTGWALYIGLKKNKVLGIALVALLIGGGVLAVKYIPTLNQRLGYLNHTYIMFKKGERSGNYSDMGRLISYDIAWRLINENKAYGTGMGDVLDEMKHGYDRWYPQIPDHQRLVPHNQFMVVALGLGIPGLLLFFIWVFMPLRLLRRYKGSFFFFITWAVLLIPLMVEPMLEVQYGVFVYLFFLLLHRQALTWTAGVRQE